MTLKSSTRRGLAAMGRARWPLAEPVKRMRVLLLLIAVVFSMCAGRALQVQAFDAKAYATEAADRMQESQVLPASRGDLTDRYGAVLAYTEQTVNVVADPELVNAVTGTLEPSENSSLPPVTWSFVFGRSLSTTRDSVTGDDQDSCSQLPAVPPTVDHSRVESDG